MDESSFTVLWYTEEPGIAWVELEDDSSARDPKFFPERLTGKASENRTPFF